MNFAFSSASGLYQLQRQLLCYCDHLQLEVTVTIRTSASDDCIFILGSYSSWGHPGTELFSFKRGLRLAQGWGTLGCTTAELLEPERQEPTLLGESIHLPAPEVVIPYQPQPVTHQDPRAGSVPRDGSWQRAETKFGETDLEMAETRLSCLEVPQLKSR